MIIFCALQEWPEEDYPIYANGPGYVISSDIADAILSEFLNHKLRVSSVDCFRYAFYDTNSGPYGSWFSAICMLKNNCGPV